MSTRLCVFSSVDMISQEMDFLKIFITIKRMKKYVHGNTIIYYIDQTIYGRFTYVLRVDLVGFFNLIQYVWCNLYRSYVIYIMNRILLMKIQPYFKKSLLAKGLSKITL